MTRRGKLLGMALVGGLALALGWVLGERLFRHLGSPPDIAGIYLPDAQALPPFQLVHQSGRPFTNNDLLGHWTFLYFGYSYCPDVCPLALTDLNRLQRRLATAGADGDTAYLFVSVDPQRDTPERLREYCRQLQLNDVQAAYIAFDYDVITPAQVRRYVQTLQDELGISLEIVNQPVKVSSLLFKAD